jgi:hypothetical protein
MVVSLEVANDRLSGVRMSDGTLAARQVLVITPRFMARAEVLTRLGLQLISYPLGVGELSPLTPRLAVWSPPTSTHRRRAGPR